MSGNVEEDVNMASQQTRMSIDWTQESLSEEDSDSEYSGDETETDEDLKGLLDDIDGRKLTKFFDRYFASCLSVCNSRRENIRIQQPVGDENPDKYDFTYPKRGLAVVINNEKFPRSSQMDSRPGSEYDAADLVRLFKQLGFKVKVYSNLTSEQMVLKLKKTNLKYDHSKADCFACAILSHGESVELETKKPPYDVKHCEDVVFGVDGVMVKTKHILQLFNDFYCPELEGKPRLFFIQACRGTGLDDGVDMCYWQVKKSTVGKKRHHSGTDRRTMTDAVPSKVSHESLSTAAEDDMHVDVSPGEILRDNTDGPRRESKIVTSPSPLYKDFLLMYSSPPGFFAWRRTSGAWFIQGLKSVIEKADLSTAHLTKLLTCVNRRVALKYEANSDAKWKDKKKQVPCIMSMLTKDVYFLPKQ